MSQITITCPACVCFLMSHQHRQPLLCPRWKMKLEANLAGFPPHKQQTISQQVEIFCHAWPHLLDAGPQLLQQERAEDARVVAQVGERHRHAPNKCHARARRAAADHPGVVPPKDVAVHLRQCQRRLPPKQSTRAVSACKQGLLASHLLTSVISPALMSSQCSAWVPYLSDP